MLAMRILTIIAISVCTGFVPLLAHADFLGAKVGIANWDQSPKGTLRYLGGSDIDIEDDVRLDGQKEPLIWLSLEHPIPLFPNIRLQSSKLNNSGSSTLSSGIDFGNTSFPSGESVSSSVNIDQTDVTLYYEILDNIVSLDVGLNIKHIDGSARIRSKTSGLTESTKFDGYIPMLYGNASVAFPLTGLSANLNGSAVSYEGHSIYDITANIAYQTDYLFGVEGGLRQQRVELDELDDVSSDIDFDGPYLGIYLHF